MIFLKKLYISATILFIFLFFLTFNGCAVEEKLYNAVSTDSKQPEPTIIIDAGHGGFDGGASTKDGVPEKNINLSISLYLNDYLKAFGFNTVLTRVDDSSLENDGLNTIRKKKRSDLHNRMKLMEKTNNAIFISIHQNSFPVEKYNGMQVFYTEMFPEESSRLAQLIQDNTVKLVQKNNTRQIKPCGTSVYLIYNAKKPACLVECGFLSNNEEAQKLKTEQYQKQIAFCIALGIQEFFYIKD